jgi:hypothetical protein
MELGQINRIDISLDEIEKTNLIGTKESEVFEKIYAIMKEEFPELEFNETSPNLQYILYFNQIVNELEKANKAFPFFTSLHEGYAVLKEEVEEFWFEVKLLKYNETHEEMDSYLKIEKELIQIAAMALKNLHFVNEAKKIQGKSK